MFKFLDNLAQQTKELAILDTATKIRNFWTAQGVDEIILLTNEEAIEFHEEMELKYGAINLANY